MPGKKLSRFLGNEKARAKILSGTVIALITVALTSSLFLIMETTAATTPYFSDDFEDNDFTNWDDIWGTVSQDTTIYHNGTGSALFNVSTENIKLDKYSLNNNTIFSAEIYFRADSSGIGEFNDYTLIQFGDNQFGEGTNAAKTFLKIIYGGDGYWHIDAITRNSTGATIDSVWNNNTIVNDTWCQIRISSNGTGITWWVNGTVIASNMYVEDTQIYNSTQLRAYTDCHFDDFRFWNVSDGWGTSSSPLPSAPTGATATAYTNFDISLSGLDANSRITFPTAHTNDISGDIVWANETSYGVLTVSNDGVQQINLSWTKGSGATKTVIRRDTTSHATWTLSTGSLLANITDNYYNIGSLSPGTHYYFALWSWNSSGYSETYATCDAIVGNASITNLTIHIEDVGSGTALVPKENFTLYGNASGSYVPLGAFDATTGNVTLTTSYAGLPLAIGDKLYFEFKAVVGAGAQPDGTYYDNNSQTLDCYVTAER